MGVSWSIYAGKLVHVVDLSVACRLSEFLGSKRSTCSSDHSFSAMPHNVLKIMMLARWSVQLENLYRPICVSPMV